MNDGIGSISTLAKRSYPAWLFFGGIFLIFLDENHLGIIILALGIMFGFLHWIPSLVIRIKQAIREPITREELEGDDAVPAEKEISHRETPDYTAVIKREVYEE